MGPTDEAPAQPNYAVWTLSDPKQGAPVKGNEASILNPCLALMKHLMSSRDKTHIQNVICSRFSLDAMMEAHRIIFTYSEPEERYVYRGPNKVVNIRDRCTHAFERIFTKLSELDAQDKMPIISCPSEDFGLLLSLHNDPVAVDDRFRELEAQVKNLKEAFKEIAPIIGPLINKEKAYPDLHQASGIRPTTRLRLRSESKKRRLDEDGESQGADSETESNEEPFALPHAQQKRIDRRSYSSKVKEAGNPNRPQEQKKPDRPKAIWGKAKANAPASDELSGPPPALFLMNCKKQVTEENVKNYFAGHSITLLDVERKSHDDARKKSFVLTVSNRTDYNKIISGDIIPEDVGVRQYFRRTYTKTERATSNKSSDIIADFLKESSSEMQSLPSTEVNLVTNTAQVTTGGGT